jgi:hypothetical protein
MTQMKKPGPFIQPSEEAHPYQVNLEDEAPSPSEPEDGDMVSICDVHGFSLEPMPVMLPRAKAATIVFAVGPLVVVWDWKVKKTIG